MSQITRCPACGTMFKVVADQLKVSKGWVRCGHCAEVFDATLNYHDPQNPPSAPHSPHSANLQSPQPSSGVSEAPLASSPENNALAAPPISAQLLTPSADETVPGHLSTSAGGIESQWIPDSSLGPLEVPKVSDSEFDQWAKELAVSADPDGHDGRDGSEGAGKSMPAASAGSRALPVAAPQRPKRDEPATDVSFVRDAERKAYWRKPVVRAGLAVVSLLLAACLLVQVAVHQRDFLAARNPALIPALQAVCQSVGCEIAPLRRIDAVVIDSSTFNKTGNDAYRLSFSLKNTLTTPVAIPTLEVTLTDTQDQPTLRKVVTPAQFGAATAMLAAGADLPGVVAMQVNASPNESAEPPRVAGYRVLIFYP